MTLLPDRSPENVTIIADIFDLPERVHPGVPDRIAAPAPIGGGVAG